MVCCNVPPHPLWTVLFFYSLLYLLFYWYIIQALNVQSFAFPAGTPGIAFVTMMTSLELVHCVDWPLRSLLIFPDLQHKNPEEISFRGSVVRCQTSVKKTLMHAICDKVGRLMVTLINQVHCWGTVHNGSPALSEAWSRLPVVYEGQHHTCTHCIGWYILVVGCLLIHVILLPSLHTDLVVFPLHAGSCCNNVYNQQLLCLGQNLRVYGATHRCEKTLLLTYMYSF